MVDLRFQGRKAERAKRDMAVRVKGVTTAALLERHDRLMGGNPYPASTLDLVIALLTGVIVMGVMHG